MKRDASLINELVLKAIKLSKSKINEVERCSWMVVHEFIHGSMPVEYDIRDVDEALYLKVLEKAKLVIQETID